MKKILYFILILFSFQVEAQVNINSLHFTVDDGLPSNEVYKIYKDSIGYYWLATDRGVSRFNGFEFKNFTAADSLPDIVIFDIQSDNFGRIWFMGQNGMLGFYKNNKFHKYKYNYKIKNEFKNDKIKGGQNLFFIDSLGSLIYTHLFAKKVIKIDSLGNINILYEDEKINKSFLSNDFWLILKNKKYNKKTFLIIDKTGKKREYILTQDKINDQIHNSLNVVKIDNIYYTNFNNIIAVLGDTINRIELNSFNNGIFNFYDKLCVASFNGIYVFNGKNKKIQKNIFAETVISGVYVFINDNNAYWVTTVGDGVYYVPSINAKYFKTEDNKVKAVDFYKENLFYVTLNNVYKYYLNSKQLNTYKLPKKMYVDDFVFNALSNNTVCINEDTLELKSTKIKHFARNNDFLKKVIKNKDVTFLISRYRIDVIRNNKKRINIDRFLINGAELYNDTLWLASTKGVYTFDIKTNKISEYKLNIPKILNFLFVTQVYNVNDSLMIIGTKGEGLYFYNKQKRCVINKFSSQNMLSGDVIKKIIPFHSFIFCGTENGIDLLDIDKLILLRTKKILPKYSEIQDIKIHNNNIYIAYNQGLLEYPIEDLFNISNKQKAFITNVKVNLKDTVLKNKYILDYNQNNILISVDAVTQAFKKNFKYYYKLKGTEMDWIPNTDKTISLINLNPGKYNLLIKADLFSGKIDDEIIFEIKPPFWQALWFKVSIILMLIIVGALLYYIKQKNKIKQSKQEFQMLMLRQKALNKQLNPHFIFNALNSINNFILKNKKEESSIYLSKFANLTRQVLDNSQNSLITLEKEIESLKLYVDIEKLRFKEKINFIFDIAENVDLYRYNVPPLILQPYVENAILHGLLPKNSAGTITIKIVKENDNLICYIIDDGVGYGNSPSNKLYTNKKSLAHKIEMSRIDIVNHMYKINMTVEYQNSDEGTIVKIVIPKIPKQKNNK